MTINIVLIGMPGSGKSSLSKIIGRKLNRPVIDIDSYIEEHEEKTIKEMFAINEGYFRDMETKYSIRMGQLDSHIIATGGGIVKRKENIDNLKRKSVIVFVNRPVEEIVRDIDVSARPLLAEGVQAVYKLYDERIHLYREYSHIEVDNIGQMEDLADLIIERVKVWKSENTGY